MNSLQDLGKICKWICYHQKKFLGKKKPHRSLIAPSFGSNGHDLQHILCLLIHCLLKFHLSPSHSHLECHGKHGEHGGAQFIFVWFCYSTQLRLRTQPESWVPNLDLPLTRVESAICHFSSAPPPNFSLFSKQDLSSLTRNWTHAPCSGNAVFTRPTGKSPGPSHLFFFCPVPWFNAFTYCHRPAYL